MKKLFTLLFVLVVFNTAYSQDTILVPGDYSTIQAAINSSTNGDIVLVSEGTYYENIKFIGKKIIVASHFILDSNTIHINNTIINGSQPINPNYGSVVTFDNYEDTSSVICGFTITGGTGTNISNQGTAGGAILARSGCTIINNKITSNYASDAVVGRWSFGGGIAGLLNDNRRIIIRDNEIFNNSVSSYSYSGGAGIGIAGTNDCLISDNLIFNNSVSIIDIHSRISGGGGIWIDGYTSEIKRNIIMNNSAPLGGAILASTNFSIRLFNNTITQNHASYQGGGLYLYVGYANTMNNIIWDNIAPKDSNVFYRGYLDFNYSITDIQMTGTGNHQSNPMFIDTLYHLASNSPAIDAGNPDALFNDFEDPANPGFALWPAMGTTMNDIGGYGATDLAHLPISGFQMVDEFLPYSFPGLVYRIAYPSEYDSTQRYPLSIVLHGSGNVGTNNIDQLWMGLLWRANAQAYGYNDFTVVPQSPTNPWSITNLHNLIQYLISNYPIDTNRVVVTGWSMGGFAVGSMLQQYPRTFAAGIPISGVIWGDNLIDTPLWIFHGDNDNNVNVQVSRSLVNNLQQLGIPVLETKNINEIELDNSISSGTKFLYTEIPGSDHFIITRIYENYYLYKWLSLTKRPSIFPYQVWTNPEGYVEPGNSIVILSTFNNPNNYLANYKAVIENLENDTLQIIQLYDDGLHGDSLSNDGIWGNISQIISDEQIFRVGIEVYNTDLNEVFYFRAKSRFTSIGPAVLNNFEWANLTAYFTVKPFIKNESTSTTITNASVKLICNDPWVTSITSPNSLPDISPGSIVSPYNPFIVVVNNSIFPGYFNFKAEVSSDNWPYWTDTMRVETMFQLSVSVVNGWNIVSIPGLHPANQNVLTWWPGKDPSADVFKYGGVGYNAITDATPGEGYWMKHLGANVYNTGDEWPAIGIQFVQHNPIAANLGWNLIGGYELSVGTTGVTTNPPGLQSGPIYKYSGGYQVATTLDPGNGYWIKLTGAGQIIISETLLKGKSKECFPENWGKIILTDAAGVSYTLYAVNEQVDLKQYELPPAPPAGMFDIRYSSGRIAEDLSSDVQIIEMQGITYPITIKTDRITITIQDENGKIVNDVISPEKELTINNSSVNKLVILSAEMEKNTPACFSLEQNYPNPYNPSTVISYQLPVNSEVTLKVYDILGREVVTLVNEEKQAGEYEVEFSATTLPSGVYFYQLKAGSFIETKKMILLK